MAWRLLLSAVTIGASLITRNEEDSKPSSRDVLSRDNRLFLSGAVMGLGLSFFFSFLSTQFRISERVWLFWLYLTNVDESRDLKRYRRPSPALDATEVIRKNEHGELRLLLSPNTALTSSLHVSVLSIKPNSEIPSQHARGVEFYYVLSGTGAVSQQGLVETHKIVKGDCFVVDSGNMRWINTKEAADELKLLRVTDGGNRYSNPTFDQIRRDPNYKSALGEIAERFVHAWKSSDKLWRRGSSSNRLPAS